MGVSIGELGIGIVIWRVRRIRTPWEFFIWVSIVFASQDRGWGN